MKHVKYFLIGIAYIILVCVGITLAAAVIGLMIRFPYVTGTLSITWVVYVFGKLVCEVLQIKVGP